MRAVLIHVGPSSGTAREADLWQIKLIDLLFMILFGKERICQVLPGAAKLETALKSTSSLLQVEAKHKFSRRNKLGKKKYLGH